MAFSDQEILARIIECEAGGEGETGMKAVACVVMNRVNITYGEYGRIESTVRRWCISRDSSCVCVKQWAGSIIGRISITCGPLRCIMT